VKIILSSVLLCFVLVAPALADSDGYYCVSEGYLAYEQASWSSPEKKHVLRVIRLSDEEGKPRTVVLEDFQVHGMKCEPNEVEILGWDKHHIVSIPKSGDPSLKSTTSRTPGASVPEFESNRLNVGPSRTVPIPTRGQPRFELTIVHTGTNNVSDGGGMIYHKVVTSIVQKDTNGKTVRVIELLKNEYDEPVH
jgi:hypothetical protein